MIKLKDLLKEAPQIKKVKNVSVQYMDAEYQGETLHGFTPKYFKKGPWLYKKDNGEYFAVVITNKNNRYEIQLGNKPKNNMQATAAVEKIIKKNLNKFESVNEKLAMGDEYVGTARLKDGRKVMLYRSNEADKWSIGKKHGIKKWDYYLLVRGKGADYIVDTGTKILSKAGKWAQGYIQRKLSGTGKERFS